MTTITITDIKKHGAASISDVDTSILIVNSKPKSAIVPIEEYEMMLDALEEIEDKQSLIERESEPTLSSQEFFAKTIK